MRTYLLETAHTQEVIGYFKTLYMAKLEARNLGFSVKITTLVGRYFGEGSHAVVRVFDLCSGKWTRSIRIRGFK